MRSLKQVIVYLPNCIAIWSPNKINTVGLRECQGGGVPGDTRIKFRLYWQELPPPLCSGLYQRKKPRDRSRVASRILHHVKCNALVDDHTAGRVAPRSSFTLLDDPAELIERVLAGLVAGAPSLVGRAG